MEADLKVRLYGWSLYGWRFIYTSCSNSTKRDARGRATKLRSLHMAFTFTVNGKSATVDVPADMPLLWVIRDVLDLKGTKFGCGAGLCGACTVHLDGRAIRSCQTPVSTVASRQVTTLEGLSADGTHPLQIAWQEIDVPQCGYCQAGQIMSAAALLARTPKPTDADIDTAMTGNLCRCATYLRIREAIHKAAAMSPARPRPTETARAQAARQQ
jgi:isoquinoline 1-oxidoreductase subunit alpha